MEKKFLYFAKCCLGCKYRQREPNMFFIKQGKYGTYPLFREKKQRSLGYDRRKHWMHYQNINALGSGSESRAQFPQNKQKDTYKSVVRKNSLNAIANMR